MVLWWGGMGWGALVKIADPAVFVFKAPEMREEKTVYEEKTFCEYKPLCKEKPRRCDKRSPCVNGSARPPHPPPPLMLFILHAGAPMECYNYVPGNLVTSVDAAAPRPAHTCTVGGVVAMGISD